MNTKTRRLPVLFGMAMLVMAGSNDNDLRRSALFQPPCSNPDGTSAEPSPDTAPQQPPPTRIPSAPIKLESSSGMLRRTQDAIRPSIPPSIRDVFEKMFKPQCKVEDYAVPAVATYSMNSDSDFLQKMEKFLDELYCPVDPIIKRTTDMKPYTRPMVKVNYGCRCDELGLSFESKCLIPIMSNDQEKKHLKKSRRNVLRLSLLKSLPENFDYDPLPHLYNPAGYDEDERDEKDSSADDASHSDASAESRGRNDQDSCSGDGDGEAEPADSSEDSANDYDSFGVYRVKRSKRYYARKTFGDMRAFMRERDLALLLNDIRMPRMVCWEWFKRFPSIVYEYIHGTDSSMYMYEMAYNLHGTPNGRHKMVIKFVFAVVHTLLALVDLHALGYVHGDIKCQNIIIDLTGMPHIIDLDLSRISSLMNHFGTNGYYAPELLGLVEGPAGIAVDFWSFGVVIMRWLCAVWAGCKDRNRDNFLKQAYINQFKTKNPNATEEAAEEAAMKRVRQEPSPFREVLDEYRPFDYDEESGIMHITDIKFDIDPINGELLFYLLQPDPWLRHYDTAEKLAQLFSIGMLQYIDLQDANDKCKLIRQTPAHAQTELLRRSPILLMKHDLTSQKADRLKNNTHRNASNNPSANNPANNNINNNNTNNNSGGNKNRQADSREERYLAALDRFQSTIDGDYTLNPQFVAENCDQNRLYNHLPTIRKHAKKKAAAMAARQQQRLQSDEMSPLPVKSSSNATSPTHYRSLNPPSAANGASSMLSSPRANTTATTNNNYNHGGNGNSSRNPAADVPVVIHASRNSKKATTGTSKLLRPIHKIDYELFFNEVFCNPNLIFPFDDVANDKGEERTAKSSKSNKNNNHNSERKAKKPMITIPVKDSGVKKTASTGVFPRHQATPAPPTLLPSPPAGPPPPLPPFPATIPRSSTTGGKKSPKGQ